MRKVLRFTTMAILVITSLPSQAQGYREVLKEIKKRNDAAKRISIVMEIAYYANAADKLPIYSQKAFIKKDQLNYWYKVNENEMLMNDKELIMVDHSLKQIMIGNRDKNMEMEFAQSLKFDMDSLLSMFGEPELISNQNGVRHYKLRKVQNFNEVDFYLDMHNYAVRKLEYEYDDGQFISINFPEFNLNASLSIADFDSGRYIKRSNGHVIPAISLKGYAISGEGI